MLPQGIRRLFHLDLGHRGVADDVDAELRFHLATRAEALVAGGMTEVEARAQALREFGDPRAARRELEAIDHGHAARRLRAEWWDETWRDARYAFRGLARTPVFTAVAVLTLALGIGANTAIFTAVNAVLLRPLPYPESDRLVEVSAQQGSTSDFMSGVSYLDLLDLRNLRRDFAGVAGYSTERRNLTGLGAPREIEVAAATTNVFAVLGVPPLVGRTFGRDEAEEPVAVLAHSLWLTRFGGDPRVTDRRIWLDGRSYRIVGVMPARFRFPNGDVRAWTPIGSLLASVPGARTSRGVRTMQAVARLAPGATPTLVRTDLAFLFRRLVISLNGPDTVGTRIAFDQGMFTNLLDKGYAARPLSEGVVGDVRPTLMILFGVVALVLLIACANAANLLLARAAARRREIAVRQSLGAGRARLVRQLLTESVLLALGAAVLGVVLAHQGLAALLALWPRALPRAGGIGLDGRVLAFTALLAVATGIAFGLAPAWNATAPGIEGVLRDDTAGVTGGWRRRLQGGLMVGQLTLALVLLLGAGLLVQSFIRLNDVDPGFDPSGVLAARIRLTPSRYAGLGTETTFYDRVLGDLEARPGVASASVSTSLPLSGDLQYLPVVVSHRAPFFMAVASVVTPDYFKTMGITIRRGRGFGPLDAPGSPRVAVISEALAHRLWGAADPIGEIVPLGSSPTLGHELGPVTVVGVVGDLHDNSLQDAAPTPELYLPLAQATVLSDTWDEGQWLLVRSSTGAPLRLAGLVQDAIRRADPDQPIGELLTLSGLVARGTAARRLSTSLLGVFAVLAVGLSVVGIYGITSYAVTERTREMGLRMALGARPGDVVGLMLRESLRRVAVGVGLGLALAPAAALTLRAMLFGVGVVDPRVYLGTALALATVAMLATLVPAGRAVRIDPMIALRHD